MKDSSDNSEEITSLLHNAYLEGNHVAMNKLYTVVLHELRRLARSQLRHERPNHTLQTDALVAEACMNLINQHTNWQNRAHFYGIAATVMRNILLNHARSKRSKKRGEKKSWENIDLSLDEAIYAETDENDEDFQITLDTALNELSKLDTRQVKIFELLYFAGFTYEETAELLKISITTVKREWKSAKAWLYRKIYGNK